MSRNRILCAAFAAILFAMWANAAEIILPEGRNAIYSAEPLEIAVSGLAKDAAAAVKLLPKTPGLAALEFSVKGEDAASLVRLPAFALAPGEYTLQLDGKEAGKLTVASGVNLSPMLLSQTGGAKPLQNFIVGNSFGWGLTDNNGLPLKTPRGKTSSGFNQFDTAIKRDLPTVVYMYWTGYVTHKPFGSEKSWPNEAMVDATRLLNFHNAQYLRRFAPNIHCVGTLDEPGLSWGKTPAGGMASGFPNWDEKPWYESRGWKYTDDISAGSDADWIKYMTIRCGILKEVNNFAKNDLKTVWPDLKFSTDLYAPQAIMDGTDPLNQQINDFPSSHVFMDWGCGKMGALSGVYLEKAHDPASKLAHAMNGQLFGEKVEQPNQRDAYRLMLNAMLAAGLHSNWWLNTGGMKDEDLTAVNEPGLRLGALFHEMELKNHDVAVLWSFTEAAMRQKDMAAKESKKKDGEQIKLMVASMPENSAMKSGEINISAYYVGGNYKEQILTAHQALSRAGYPAHIIHEKTLPAGSLKQYKTLVIVGQTFELPAEIKQALAAFTSSGGKIIVDGTTTQKFDGAIATSADFKDPAARWTALFTRADKKDHGFKTNKEASYFQTNNFMEEMVRAAVKPIKETMSKSDSKPAIVTDSTHLAAEKHAAGEGALIMVINAFDKLPEIADDKKYPIYNYAPYNANFTLNGIPAGSAVYCIEGAEWKKVSKVADASKPISAEFAAGEMKLYLIAPKDPQGLNVSASAKNGELAIEASLKSGKLPWPLTLTVKNPEGKEIYRVHRATNKEGAYRENVPLGTNAAPGAYTVSVESPAGDFTAQASADVKAQPAAPAPIADAVRVFDGDSIQKFLATKPEIVIALGNDAHKPVAESLAKELSAKGVKVSIKPEAEAVRKAAYPRVWNPYAKIVSATGEEKPAANAKLQIELGQQADGSLIAKTSDGKNLAHDWRQPNSVITIGGTGYVDYNSDHETCYEPGVKLFVNEQRQLSILKGETKTVPTTAEFKAKWAKPWDRIGTHVGAYQLPPELPEAFAADTHLILLGDSNTSNAVAALQASELLRQVVDEKYPGKGRALISFAWSPFAVEKNAILLGATDEAGIKAAAAELVKLVK
jgi:hypothetical protein